MSMIRPDTGDFELNQKLYGDRARKTSSWVTEEEVRLMVKKFDWSIIEGYANPVRIEQGYFQSSPYCSCRLRIINQDKAVLTKKVGFGLTRAELEVDLIDTALAQTMYEEMCLHRVVKTRYSLVGGWQLDIYEHPTGLVIAEYEGKDALKQLRNLPSWIREADDITNSVTNADIACWAYEQEVGLLQCSVQEMLRPIPKIILAGGPGSGKSTLFAGLCQQFGEQITSVVEAARVLIETVGHKPPVGDEIAMNWFERGIYNLQVLLVKLAEDRARRIGAKAVLLDRHQMDVFTYLGANRDRFERVCDTRVDYEYTKADLVLYCQMPPRDVYEAYCMNDKARWEDYTQAVETDARLREVYQGFGERLVEIPFCALPEEKLRMVEAIISRFLGLGQ